MRTRLITLRLRCPQPFWLCTPEEIQGGAAEAYVFKSFGDMHTTVPVYPHQSERTGRFVRLEVRTHARTHARTQGQAITYCSRRVGSPQQPGLARSGWMPHGMR
eukprot:SAG25_NODE_194_length_12183_cov_70.943893_17_plen_104_part_00